MSMRVAKEAVKYYCMATGNNYDDFFLQLDLAVATPNPTGDLWLVRELLNTLKGHNISINELKANKDTVRGELDSINHKQEGEFYTPEAWCAEGRKYFDKYIPNWHEYNVYDGSCGTGNLMRTSGHPQDKLFLSTLRQEDVDLVKQSFPKATVFQLNFLNKLDYDLANLEFLEQLPIRLQEIIKNDEPLIIYMNPPYKSGLAKTTDVGKCMCDNGLSRAASDLIHQFLWRVMKLVDMFNLSNTWFCFFCPSIFFTGASAGQLMEEFEHCFEYIDGMCLPASEFSDTSKTVSWCITCALWKARGGYKPDRLCRDKLFDVKRKDASGNIVCSGRTLYAPPRVKLSDWVKPNDVVRYKQAPIMMTFSSFKGEELGVKKSTISGRLAENALGTLITRNVLASAYQPCGIFSMPPTSQYVDITKENFWRCVASSAFRRSVVIDWTYSRKELSAPVETVEGYNVWLMNAITIFLFDWKSFMASLRNVEWNNTRIDIRNYLFFCSADEVRSVCDDEVILKDLETHPPVNQFVLEQIEKAKPYWCKESWDLYNFCKEYVLNSFKWRKEYNYGVNTECWDAGMKQIRACEGNKEEVSKQLQTYIDAEKAYLNKDIYKFGFI